MNSASEVKITISKFTIFAATILMLTACNLPNTVTQVPPTNTAALGNVVRLNNVTVTIPTDLANDAASEMVSASTDPNTAPWEIAPAHIEFTLTGYQLQDKFHPPKIYVYPADEYAQINNGAAESLQRLRSVLSGAPLTKENMPGVPFFNAGSIIAAQTKVVTFQNGSGIRTVTEFAQYPTPINNHELVYHFQGLTNDGKYYIVAILPITAPILAESDDPKAPVPAGGVSLPVEAGPSEAYYAAVTEGLNALGPDAFRPSLTVLDAMIQSIVVTPL